MEQVGLAQTGRRPQVDLDRAGLGHRLEACGPLLLGEVGGERDLGCRVRDDAERVADDQPLVQEVETAGHGVGGVEHLGQPRAGAAAERRERVGQPGTGDQVIG